MQQQQEQQLVDDLGFCPSFNCYSSTSTSAARISTQLRNEAEEEDEFEFSLVNEHEHEHSSTSFPLFNYNPLVQNNNKVDEVQEHEQEETSETSDTSSDNESHVFCVWRHNNNKPNMGALSKCKKSSSTGSGSKRWRIRDLLRRSNSEGKGQPMVSTVAGKVKPVAPAVHELWYAKQRGKRDGGKRRSYLPYRQGLVGFFNNVNGSGKKLSF